MDSADLERAYRNTRYSVDHPAGQFRTAAAALGSVFGQNAVVVGHAGAVARWR
jgi:hypothetical protein